MFDLSLEVLRVVEEAAVASARTMGMGDAHLDDQPPRLWILTVRPPTTSSEFSARMRGLAHAAKLESR